MLHKELYLIILIAASYPWLTSQSELADESRKQRITCARSPLLSCDTGLIKIWSAEYIRVDSPDCPFSTDGINCNWPTNVQTLISESCDGEAQCDTGPIINCGRQYNALDILYTCETRPRITWDLSTACEGTSLTIDCGGQDVIKILTSNYGRTDHTTCIAGRPSSQIQNAACRQPEAYTYMAKRCDGKTRCSAVASNSVFSDPCGGTFKYLEVSYTCMAPGN